MTRQNGEGGVKKTRTNVTPNLSCYVLIVQVNKQRHTDALLAQETGASTFVSAFAHVGRFARRAVAFVLRAFR